jgi:hypothetical protein
MIVGFKILQKYKDEVFMLEGQSDCCYKETFS